MYVCMFVYKYINVYQIEKKNTTSWMGEKVAIHFLLGARDCVWKILN